MRIAVISDIHGNCSALDAVIADLNRRAVDSIVCLGDAVQGGHQPAQTVARLRELGCPVVMGNSDAWLLSGQLTDHEPVTPEQVQARDWSLAQLSIADREYTASFQPTVRVPLYADRDLLAFHGTPASFDELIFPETPHSEVMAALGAYLPAVLAGGHTHTPQVRRLGDSFFFNPSSVGAVYDRNSDSAGDPFDAWAEYAILDASEDRTGLDLRRVPVDVVQIAAEIRASGMPNASEKARRYEPR